MKSMPISSADLQISLKLWEGGRITAYVGTAIPGSEPFDRVLQADKHDPDEVTTMANDFHNEWRAWGNLMDCVLEDWSGSSAMNVQSWFSH